MEPKEKLLFVPIIPEAKSEGKIWLSHQVVGLALEIHQSQEVRSLRKSGAENEPCNRFDLYVRFDGMKALLYLDETRLSALEDFITAYDSPDLSFESIYEQIKTNMIDSDGALERAATDELPEDRQALIQRAVDVSLAQSDTSAGRYTRVRMGMPEEYSEFMALLSRVRSK